MYWQEKIDLLKKKFPPSDFRDPFTGWSDILKKVESKFIIKNSADYQYSNWEENIKNKTLLRTISKQTIYRELFKLKPDENYWTVVVNGNTPTSKHLIYDCKVNSLEALLSNSFNDFYLVDKKYNWLTFFKVNEITDQITIYKSGIEQTPFESVDLNGSG